MVSREVKEASGQPAAEERLSAFLAKHTPEIASRAAAILDRMRSLVPGATELVYDNYNALAIGFGPGGKMSHAVFSIAVYPRWVSLFFLQAKGLADPAGLLRGGGNVVRHIVLDDVSSLDNPAIQDLMRQALANAVEQIDPSAARKLVIKSVSARQRPRRPA